MAITIGTAKQIDWATDIRRKVIDVVTTEVERNKRCPDYAEIKDRLATTVAELELKTSAQWWIDNRNRLATTLTVQVVEG